MPWDKFFITIVTQSLFVLCCHLQNVSRLKGIFVGPREVLGGVSDPDVKDPARVVTPCLFANS